MLVPPVRRWVLVPAMAAVGALPSSLMPASCLLWLFHVVDGERRYESTIDALKLGYPRLSARQVPRVPQKTTANFGK